MSNLRDPRAIEMESFSLIRAFLSGKDFPLPERIVIERVIHATADFSYAEALRFSCGAVERGLVALRQGCSVVTDTRMAWAGINREVSQALGVEIHCALDEEGVGELSQKRGITRAMASIIKAAEKRREALFLVGNAPTALFTVVELFWEGKISPPLVVGVPVGLVGAKEAKEALEGTTLSYITTSGPKGGTPVAVAIFHALCKLALEDTSESG